jgi:hypothetical protein
MKRGQMRYTRADCDWHGACDGCNRPGSPGTQTNTMKTKSIITLTSASLLLLGFVSCDSKMEETREENIEQKADNLENRADRVRDQGETRADRAEEVDKDDSADRIRTDAEKRADQLEDQADSVRDTE